MAYGGYLEEIFTIEVNHFNAKNIETPRNIHLGVDFWCTINTNVLAILDGEIYSFKKYINYGDYSPHLHC